jgi:large subunit ribosomal protein L13
VGARRNPGHRDGDRVPAGPRGPRPTQPHHPDHHRTTTLRTFSPTPADQDPRWHVIDADGVVLGRLATQVATLLRGKHKPTFAPHMDMGDFVIVINASRIRLTGNKARDKWTWTHSGFPGGIKGRPIGDVLEEHHRPRAAAKAEGLRRRRAPARGAGPPAAGRAVALPETPEDHLT